MLKNYFKTAWRSLLKNKTFSLINIFGLAIGLCCCLLIAAFLVDELSYDKQSENAESLYRIELGLEDESHSAFSSVDVAVGEGMKNAFPEITAFTRLAHGGNVFFKHGDKQFKEPNYAIADSNFLQLFGVPLLQGNAATALKEPNGVVLSKAYALKYFGATDVVGKSLLFGDNNQPLKVTGVFNKIPSNTHFNFDIFIAGNTWENRHTWSNVGFYTYLQLKPGTDAKKLEAKFPQMVAKYVVPEIQNDMGVSLAEAQKSVNTFIFHLKPVTSIHLTSNNKDELAANGSKMYVYIFGALAVFIILLACVNFTNLSTASSINRSKEVGIRKVLGSDKKQLVIQFLTESVLMTMLSLVIALMGVYLLLPYFNQLSGKQLEFHFFVSPLTIFITIFACLAVGILAGIYPAFFISSFNTISVLKSSSSATTQGRSGLRSGLVVFQFAVSTALIIATIVVYQQLHYMQNVGLGFSKEQVVVINDTYLLKGNETAFKDQLKQDSRVANATLSYNVPINGAMNGTQVYAKQEKDNGTHSEIHINIYNVDYDYLSTLGMQVIKGRNFSPSFGADSTGVLINEAAATALGFNNIDPIGKTIVRSGQHQYTVVGVVKDFHYTSLKQQIAPLMMILGRNGGGMLAKVKVTDMHAFLNDVKKQWDTYNAAGPFSYTFLDDKFATVYAAEERTGQIFTLFASLSIIIAALGLFGLSAYTTQQRTKEIGVRKVLGASVKQVLVLVSKEFVYMVLISLVIAVPVTWFAMNKWLEDFAYRITIGWDVFALAGAAALLIALLTVSFRVVKAALANPVKSLRSE